MDKVNFKPLFNNILVTVEEAPDTIGEGVLVQPEIAKQKPYHGTVLRVGSAVTELQVGDRILFTRYSGKEIVIDGKEYQYMKDIEVVGVLEGDAQIT